MALYSWFIAGKNNQNKNSQVDSRMPNKLTDNNNYLDGFTKWPVARVIPGKKIVTTGIKKTISHTEPNSHVTTTKKFSYSRFFRLKHQS